MGERHDRDPKAARDEARDVQLRERLASLDERLQLPMAVLGLIWLALLVADIAWGTPAWADWLSGAIWTAFIAEFAARFALAPDKRAFLRTNWFVGLSLLLPALRVFSALRALRAASAVRSLQLARVVSRLSTVKGSLAKVMRQHGLRYVLLLTVLVTFGGAAGMFAFERDHGQGFRSYGDALWWTAMLITTIASQDWPVTLEGRVLAVLLSGYALGVLGYITAALARFLIGGGADRQRDEIAVEPTVDALRADIARLAAQIERLAERSEGSPPHAPDREPGTK